MNKKWRTFHQHSIQLLLFLGDIWIKGIAGSFPISAPIAHAPIQLTWPWYCPEGEYSIVNPPFKQMRGHQNEINKLKNKRLDQAKKIPPDRLHFFSSNFIKVGKRKQLSQTKRKHLSRNLKCLRILNLFRPLHNPTQPKYCDKWFKTYMPKIATNQANQLERIGITT